MASQPSTEFWLKPPMQQAIPELLQSPSESPIWERDDLLMPVLEDDVLLFEAAEDSDEETAETLPSATGKGKGGV
ncbi:unnamed protein product [Durusdinium trenchii]|uniref:Uncharacterized protein n=1 Tax=Durusdinium trenchii TaxID=1381693 RepID=A0ABP0HZ26_9DINO